MNHIIRYSSSRAEVWHWYWRSWRAKFWRMHVLLAIVISFSLSGSSVNHVNFRVLVFYSLVSLPVVILVMAVVPQILFKSAVRTLQVDREGWSTQVGKVSGSRTWAGVAAIEVEEGQIVITGTNGNALIIPARAFQDAAAQQRFLNEIQTWHKQYAG